MNYTMGYAADNEASAINADHTVIQDFPAPFSGIIKTLSLYVEDSHAGANLKAHIFVNDGTNFNCIRTANMANLGAGANTVLVNLQISSGQYLGISVINGLTSINYTASGGICWYQNIFVNGPGGGGTEDTNLVTTIASWTDSTREYSFNGVLWMPTSPLIIQGYETAEAH
jgi:hypothetical protein